ncbi:hypothetical protein Tco_0738959 [Tanacetum coccineum]
MDQERLLGRAGKLFDGSDLVLEQGNLVLGFPSISLVIVSGQSGTLVGQEAAIIVTTDVDPLPRMLADLWEACGSRMWLIRARPAISGPSYNKGWMSFVKHSDAAPVCYSKPLDSVKNWNDHFFWVDSTAFPLFVSLKSKILSKDPPPKLSQYDTKACDFLRTHTALFRKFPEPFLCWVGISCYYTLDENFYPTFWDGDEEMDLFAFIRHPDPTKVRIGERDLAERKLFDEGGDAGQEHSVERDDDILEEIVAKDVSEKLKEDYHAATSNTGGKSLATICSLIPEGSSVPSETAEPRDDELVDPVFGLNLWTLSPSKRYVISSDDSYHSHSCSEVNFFARSAAADTPIMSIAVTTTVAADVSVVQVSKDRVRSGNLETFGDSASAGGANVNAFSSSKLNEPTTSSDSFYASQDLDSKTLHNIYVPKWKVTNDSVLDDPYVCRDLTDRLAPPALFPNCCAEQTTLLSEKDAEIAHLISLLSLKETEAAEAIREKDALSEKVAALESMTTSKETELASLTAQVAQLTSDLFGFQLSRNELSSKVAFLESERDRLADQRSSLEYAFELFKGRMEAMQDDQATVLGNRVAELDTQLLEMAAHLDEEFYPRFLTTISGQRWILTHELKLVLLKCLQSSEYLQALGQAIGCAVNKGIQDGLKAGVDHGKAGKDLSMIEAYDPSSEAKYFDAGPLVEIPGAEDLQPSPEQLMLPLHRPEDNVVLGETSLSFSLQVVHSRPLSAKSLIGEASTSAIPVTTESITTLAIIFASFDVVPPLSISNDQALDTEPNDEYPPVVTFEKEELVTSPEYLGLPL